MTERFLSDIREDILARIDRTPMTMAEICSSMPEDPDIIESVMLGLARDRKIALEPGTLGKRWTTRERVRAKQMEAGE